MATAGNPLIGSWPNPGGVNPPGGLTPPGFPTGPTPAPPAPGGPANPWGNPGNLPNPGSNIKDISRNTGALNVQSQQLKNTLAPQWADIMKMFGGDAGKFFQMLTSLGSPFYKQKQAESFTQGTKAGQDAAAQSRQKLGAVGAGYTPSGAGAAMFGGEAQAEAGNQAELFLNNLFQNEQLQLAGAAGESSLAGLFNPSSMLTPTPVPGNVTQGPSAAEQFAAVMGSIFGGGQSSKQLAGAA